MPDDLTPLPSVPVDEDLRHEGRRVVAGRVGRGGLALVVGLAALGVFGGAGPLVRAETHAGLSGGARSGALTVGYDRFARLDAPTRLDVRLPAGDSVFTLSGALAADLRVDATQPAPASEAEAPDGTRTVAMGSAGATVQLHARPMRAGRIAGTVGLPGGPAVRVSMVVYP